MRHQKSKSRSIPHWLAIALGVFAVMMTTAFLSALAPATASASTAVAADTKDGITLPKLISKVNPVYPESARQKKIEGLVVIEATVSDKGDVTSVAVVKGIAGDEGTALAEAALAAVRQWKFEPAKKDGKPVELKYNVTINFKLDKDKPAK